jgi:hypothetical protein
VKLLATRCLFQPVSSDTLMLSSVDPGLSFNFKTVMVLYRPRLRFLHFFSCALLPNCQIVKRVFLIMWVQQLVGFFSIVDTNLLTWLITYMKSGGNDERRAGLGWRIFVLTGERPEYSGRKYLSQRHFVHHKSLPYFRMPGRLVNKWENCGLPSEFAMKSNIAVP